MSKKIEWHEGFPEKKGAYRCLVDFEERIIIHTMCTIYNRHRWMTLDGHDIVGHDIRWTGDPLSPSEL